MAHELRPKMYFMLYIIIVLYIVIKVCQIYNFLVDLFIYSYYSRETFSKSY